MVKEIVNREVLVRLEYGTDPKFGLDSNKRSIEELLKFIFPNESHKLHNYKIKSKNYELHVEPFYHRYLWECPIKFI